jgi:hypothetical protein
LALPLEKLGTTYPPTSRDAVVVKNGLAEVV